MKEHLHKLLLSLKPGVSRKTHLLLAALLWTIIGSALIISGSSLLILKDKILLVFPALLLGSAKSLFILDKSAKKSISRIQLMADGSCLGAVYSVKTWLLVASMMALGYLLRNSTISSTLIGAVYVTVGCSLLFSSRFGWIAWKRN